MNKTEITELLQIVKAYEQELAQSNEHIDYLNTYFIRCYITDFNLFNYDYDVNRTILELFRLYPDASYMAAEPNTVYFYIHNNTYNFNLKEDDSNK